MFLKLGRKKEAEEIFRQLLTLNPETYSYHHGLACALDIYETASAPATYTVDQVSKLTALYDELSKEFPRAAAVERIPLTFTSGADFETRLIAYLQKRLRKGIPSLFRDLRALYNGNYSAVDVFF